MKPKIQNYLRIGLTAVTALSMTVGLSPAVFADDVYEVVTTTISQDPGAAQNLKIGSASGIESGANAYNKNQQEGTAIDLSESSTKDVYVSAYVTSTTGTDHLIPSYNGNAAWIGMFYASSSAPADRSVDPAKYCSDGTPNGRNCYIVVYTSSSVVTSLSSPSSLFSIERVDANQLYATARFRVKYYATSTSSGGGDKWQFAILGMGTYTPGNYANNSAMDAATNTDIFTQYTDINTLEAFTNSTGTVAFANSLLGSIETRSAGTLTNTGNIVLKYLGSATDFSCNNYSVSTGVNSADGTQALGSALKVGNGYVTDTLSTSSSALTSIKPFQVATDDGGSTTSTYLTFTVPTLTTAYGTCTSTVTLLSTTF